MRKINVIDEEGNVVTRFERLQDAAEAFGITPASAWRGIRLRTLRGGLMMEYDGDTISDEERREKRAKAEERRKLARVEGKDDMSCEEMELMVLQYGRLGITVEKVSYEVTGGIVSVTPCMKKYCEDFTQRAKVGSVKCMGCIYFKGKCRENRTVLCMHTHCTGKERLETRGKKKLKNNPIN